MNEKKFNQEVQKAKIRVMRMDSIDGHAERHLKTILMALKAGIVLNNRDAMFEAYYMLSDVTDPKPTN